MSTKGIYSALSGALAQSEKLDTIANNIANVNTTSFKRDQQLFREYLSANEKLPNVIQVPKVPASIESFYDMQGGDKSYVDSIGTYTDFSQGSLKRTGQALDLAIDGSGFFEVLTPQGVRLTRNGSLSVDGNGQLVTKEGYPLLAKPEEPGVDPLERLIHVGSANISISSMGEVYDDQNLVGQLSLVRVKDSDSLKKTGNSLYDFKTGFKPEVEDASGVEVKQGFLETSNVNVVREMTDMIATNRVFESSQKAIHAYDGMADKLVNVVGKTNAG